MNSSHHTDLLLRMIDAPRAQVGENPLWHNLDRSLYWTDIPSGCIYRHTPESGRSEKVYEGRIVGGFTIQADASLLLFMDKGSIANWTDGHCKTLIDGLPEEQDSRFNDVIADPVGRVFCGTMASQSHLGRLYRLDLDGSLTKILEGIQCSNGLAFSSDLRFLYYTDSFAHIIYRFEYCAETGDIGHQEILIQGAEADGYPDGLVRDADGYLWSARWGGSCIIRYTPEGKEERRILVPAKNVTSLAFGGPHLDEVYISTARDPEHPEEQRTDGAIFHSHIGIRGVPEFLSNIRL